MESAVFAPQNVYLYAEDADVFDIAASYLKALAKNHPFIDGNKRTATVAAISFLKINEWELDMEPAHLTLLVESLVTNRCDEVFVADFFFIACCRNAEHLFKFGITDPAPKSFKAARTKDEQIAIITDYVTSKFRVRLIEICSGLVVRPSRFDSILDKLERDFFMRVDQKWRSQFGMA